MRTEEITYTEIVKLQKILGHETYKKSVSVLKDKKNQSKLDAYIVHIIMSNNISYREKIVVLLAHFEEFVYQATIYDRQKKDKIKCVVLQKTSDLHKMESKSYKKLALAGIVFVVYSNTDNYKKIDKRIPFRNNILHRGVISYSDKEIKKSYELLVYFLSKIIFCTSDSGVENED